MVILFQKQSALRGRKVLDDFRFANLWKNSLLTLIYIIEKADAHVRIRLDYFLQWQKITLHIPSCHLQCRYQTW